MLPTSSPSLLQALLAGPTPDARAYQRACQLLTRGQLCPVRQPPVAKSLTRPTGKVLTFPRRRAILTSTGGSSPARAKAPSSSRESLGPGAGATQKRVR